MAPGGGATFIVLGSDASSTSTTLANVSGMTFTATANKTYIVDLMAIAQSSLVASNPMFALDVPDGVVTGFNTFGVNGQVYTLWNDQNADDAFVAVQANGLRANAANYPLLARWVYNAGGSGGTVNLRIRIRSATGDGTGTLKAGSVFSYQQVN